MPPATPICLALDKKHLFLTPAFVKCTQSLGLQCPIRGFNEMSYLWEESQSCGCTASYAFLACGMPRTKVRLHLPVSCRGSPSIKGCCSNPYLRGGMFESYFLWFKDACNMQPHHLQTLPCAHIPGFAHPPFPCDIHQRVNTTRHPRATEYLAEHGREKFFKWFDYMSWYPLGRPVGTTIYPGIADSSLDVARSYIHSARNQCLCLH